MSTPNTPTAPAGALPREVFVDWLRITALGLLIVFHVGMAYVGWSWHAKSVSTNAEVAAWVEPAMRLLAPWRMTLLFLVSGLATSLMLQGRAARGAAVGGTGGTKGWLRGRAARLLLPLLTGMVLIVPPQSYIEVQNFHGYAGSYLDFLGLYFSGYHGFCATGRGCLILPTWNHLWFLPYLFSYTALLALVLRRWPAALDDAGARLPSWLAGPRLWLLPLAWLVGTSALLRPIFGETHAFFGDFFLHAQFAAAFAFGVLLARAPSMWPRIEASRRGALLFALLGWAVLVATGPAPWRVVPWSVVQWCGVMAAFGYARRHLQRDNAARRRLSEAVFPVYLLHQTVTVLAVAELARWHWHPAAEALALVALTLGLSWLGFEVARRIAWLRTWFGIANRPVAPVAPAAQGVLIRAMPSRLSTYSAPSVPTSMSTGGPSTMPKR